MLDIERSKALMEYSLDTIAFIQTDGTVSYVSPSITRLLGYSPEEFIGKNPFEVVHPDDRDAAKLQFADLGRQPGNTQTVLQRVRHADNSWRWIETVATNQLENPSVHAIVANLRDVTLRRQTEDALHQQEEHFRLIVESAIDFAIFTLDHDGLISTWNTGAERILGYKAEEILGQHVSVIFTPEDNAQGRAEFEMNGALYKGHENDDRWHLKKGGIRFWANGVMMPLKYESGIVKGYLKILHDRTRHRQSEEALLNADRQKDEFLAMLAHELRNPLAAIENAVQISMLSVQKEDVEWGNAVIRRQTKHLNKLIDDLLDVSRIKAGKIKLQKEWVNLSQAINRATEAVALIVGAKKQKVTVSMMQEEICLFADATRIEQLLVNLLINASKYTDDDGQITIIAEQNEDIIIRVIDSGIGISSDALPNIFELFIQADQSIDRTQGGLGIGLTLVKKIVEMHGGTVTAVSDGLGKGSEFIIRLPITRAALIDQQQSASALGAQSSTSLRILIVDDHVDNVQGLAKLLHISGYSVTTAYDGVSALEKARADLPDVILMDIGLPGMDGYQVAKSLRTDELCKDLVLIAISGYGQDADKARSLEAGFDYHLVKPVNYSELLLLLSEQRTISSQ